MSNEMKGRADPLSRRLLLQKAIGTAAVAAVIGAYVKPAPAAIKISKAAVAYQDHPQGDKRCAACRQFQSPDSCRMVDGPVSPQGFCRIFTPMHQAAEPRRSLSMIT